MTKKGISRAGIIVAFVSPILLVSVLSCSLVPWGKRSAYTKEELARLADKDIYIIDGEKYIKVPAGKDEKGNTTFRYVKVERYLAGEVEPLPLEAERTKKRIEVERAERVEGAKKETEAGPKQTPLFRRRPLKHPYLRRKIAVLKFEDRTKFTYERFGEIIAERLTKTMETKVFTSLVMDSEMVKLAMEKLDLSAEDLRNPSKAKVLNETLGIQGVIMGVVYGPFVTSSTPVQSEKSSMAIVRIEAKFIDAALGRIVRQLAVTNPLMDSEEMGVLSDEKARYRAVDLATDQIVVQVAEEINGMEWFTRIALLERNVVYLSAGYQTGLRAGDVLEVYRGAELRSAKPLGRVRISKLFGVDASAAEIITGSGFQVNDVVRPLPQS